MPAAPLWRTALILGLVSAVGPLAIDAYLPALPTIAESLGTDVAAVQATLGVYFLCFGLAQMLYGPWADAAGRRTPLAVGLLVFGLGSLACALAPTVGTLIAARALQAFGAAAVMVIPRAIIRDGHTGAEATRLMALIMLVISVSPMLAPLLGAGLIAVAGWRAIFVVLLVASVLSLVLARLALPETLPPAARQPVRARSLLSGARRLLTDRGFMALTLVGGFGMASFFVFLANAAFVYTGYYGLSETGFSLAFAVNALGFFAASQAAGPIGARIGMPRLVTAGVTGFAATVAVLLVTALVLPLPLWLLIAFLFVANAFLGVVIPSAMVMALEEVGDIAGLASSLGGTLQMMVGTAMIALTAPFFDGTPVPLVAAIALCGALAFAASRLAPRALAAPVA